MFEKYRNDQPVVTATLINSLNNNKLSHAYIFETDNYLLSYDLVKDFIRYIVCQDSRDDSHDISKCNICSAVENENYIELKVVDTKSLQIKKEEILSLQEEFKNKAIEGTKKIYLIKSAEKLNNSSANTILKFLEEPEDNIVAILVTPSQYLLFDTIKSRCQVISLSNNQNQSDIIELIYNTYYSNDDLKKEVKDKIDDDLKHILKFVNFVEINGKDSLLYSNKYFFNYFNNREDVLMAFEIIKLVYCDMLKYKTNGKVKYFINYEAEIVNIAKKINLNELVTKINIIINTIYKIKYNVNINLLMDKFIMEMGGN